MGLDVYIERRTPEIARNIELYDAEEEKFHADYEGMTPSERDVRRESLITTARELGLSDWGGAPKVEINSAKYPGHLFKIGYFRSSYNSSGFNRIIQERTSMDGLYFLFNDPEEYEFQPNWEGVKERCQFMKRALEQEREPDGTYLTVVTVEKNMFFDPAELCMDEREAICYFKDKRKENHAFESYSDRDGSLFFMKEPLEVVALIPGVNKIFNYSSPCVYAVMKTKKDSEGDWYENAVHIVEEAADWVLQQPNKEEYWIVWSS